MHPLSVLPRLTKLYNSPTLDKLFCELNDIFKTYYMF